MRGAARYVAQIARAAEATPQVVDAKGAVGDATMAGSEPNSDEEDEGTISWSAPPHERVSADTLNVNAESGGVRSGERLKVSQVQQVMVDSELMMIYIEDRSK